MKIVTDLQYIQKMAVKREQENCDFRSYLKGLNPKEIDALVHQITAEVTAQIDCTTCANCCKQIRPILDEEDISKFALGLDLPRSEFQRHYLAPDKASPSKYSFNELPCPFLVEDRCSNYECRPKDCRSYPHLTQNDFVFRLWGVIENYAICPIVFNVFERLKHTSWHRNRRRSY